MLDRRSLLSVAAAFASPLAVSSMAQTPTYPVRPIKLICPWPAGGVTDVLMRAIAESANGALNSELVVFNKPGASGTLGAAELARSAPDGYTISQLTTVSLRLPHMQKVPFDPIKELTWIISLAGYTFGLVVVADSPIQNVAGVVAYAKENPGKFSFASPGVGTSQHLIVEQFAQDAKIQLLHVPFKGGAEAMTALLGGHVMAWSDSATWAPQVESGRLRLLATYGSKRSKRWPSVPTLSELGYGVANDSPWGIGGPSGMNAAVVKTVHDAFKGALGDPKVIAMLDSFDQPVVYMDTDTYTRWAREDYISEKNIVDKLGLARDDTH